MSIYRIRFRPITDISRIVADAEKVVPENEEVYNPSGTIAFYDQTLGRCVCMREREREGETDRYIYIDYENEKKRVRGWRVVLL